MDYRQSGIVLLAHQGRIRTSLRVLLRSIDTTLPTIETDDLPKITQDLKTSTNYLVLVDADLLDDGNWGVLDKFRTLFPQHHFVVLVHYPSQIDQASKLGLDTLIVEGVTAGSLSLAITRFFA